MKKKQQLGMDPGTASHRLVKDILFKFITDAGHVCYHCGQKMTRENFSIEHIIPWLDSEDPVKLFFDMENISFSHHACNIRAGRHPVVAPHGSPWKYRTGCKCDLCVQAMRNHSRKMRPYREQWRRNRKNAAANGFGPSPPKT